MAKDLEESLENIETALGGTSKPELKDLGEHLDYIEELIQQGGGGGAGGVQVIDLGYQESFGSEEPIMIDEETFNKVTNNDCIIKVETHECGFNFVPCQEAEFEEEGMKFKQFFSLDREGQLWLGFVEGGHGEYAMAFESMGRLSSVRGESDDNNWTSLTINGTTKNIPTRTFRSFKSGWDTTHTINDFCASIVADSSAVEGNAYMGGVVLTDFPSLQIANADIVVNIISGTEASDKVVHVTMTSGSVAPYHWEYTYWTINSDVHTSGWIPFSQVSGTVSGSNWSALTINGVTKSIPSGGGGGGSGTQLYEHLVMLDCEMDDGSSEIHAAKFISWQGASFANYEWRELCGNYLNGFIDVGAYDPDDPEYIYCWTQIITIENEQDLPYLKYYDTSDNEHSILPNNNGSWSVMSDTVTSL